MDPSAHKYRRPGSFRLGQRPNMQQPGASPLDERTRRATDPSPKGATSARARGPPMRIAIEPSRLGRRPVAVRRPWSILGRWPRRGELGLADSRPGAMPLAVSCWAVGPQHCWLIWLAAVAHPMSQACCCPESFPPSLPPCFAHSVFPHCHQPAHRAPCRTRCRRGAASPALKITFPNPNVFQSPYTWRNENGSAIAPTGGSYLKGVVQGTTTLRANVDTSLNAGAGRRRHADAQGHDRRSSRRVRAVSARRQTGHPGHDRAEASEQPHRYRVEVIGGNQIKPDGWRGRRFRPRSTAWNSTPVPRSRRRPAFATGAVLGRQQHPGLFRRGEQRAVLPICRLHAVVARGGGLCLRRRVWPDRHRLDRLDPSGAGGLSGHARLVELLLRRPAARSSLQPDYVWVALGANDHGVEPAKLTEVIVDLAQSGPAGISRGRDFLRRPLSRRESPRSRRATKASPPPTRPIRTST